MHLNTLQTSKKKVHFKPIALQCHCANRISLIIMDYFSGWHAGKIKTVALTNFDTERLQKILENGIPVVSNQVSPLTQNNVFISLFPFLLFSCFSALEFMST